jgi:hypothetical protein
MSEIFEVKCVDCANEFGVVSPAHLICQKCGSGQLEFRNAVIITCHKGHEQRGKIANEQCKTCYSFEQRSLRNFKRLEPVKKKQAAKIEETDEEKQRQKTEDAIIKEQLEKEATKKEKKKEKTTKIKTRKKK